MRIWFDGDYYYKCDKNEFNIVDVQSNGTQDPTCN
ncbi:hypothetical protein ACLED3_17040 [Lonsdalea quercina]